MSSPDTHIKKELALARRQAVFSLVLNALLASTKGAAGILSHSTALLSDAIHSAADVLASAAVFIGLWVSGKRHPSFPYGLYKAETIATLVTSMAVILAAYEIGRRAIFGCPTIVDIQVALPVALGSLVVSGLFGLYQLRKGRMLNSPALEADAKDYLADSISTLVVLIGLVGSYLGYNLDRWAAAIVSLFVFKAGGQLFLNAVKGLLDVSIDRQTEQEIISFVLSHPSVMSIKRCLSREAGGRYIVDIDVVLKTPSHQMADRISDRLEEEILERFPKVVMARIRPHYEEPEHIRRITPVEDSSGRPCTHISKANWFLLEIIDRKTGHMISKELLENPHKDASRQRGYLVGRFLLEQRPDQLVYFGEKEGTCVALLKEAGVQVIRKKPEEFTD